MKTKISPQKKLFPRHANYNLTFQNELSSFKDTHVSPKAYQADGYSCSNVTVPCFSSWFYKSPSSRLCFFGIRKNFGPFNELRGAQEEQIILCSRIIEQLKWPY